MPAKTVYRVIECRRNGSHKGWPSVMLLDEGFADVRTCTVGLRATTLPCIATTTLTNQLLVRASARVGLKNWQ